MPELSRFFGIIIRMYAEVGGPHHVPHFHAYYQDEVGIYSLDPIELIVVRCPSANGALLKLGQSCIKSSYLKIGNFCRKVINRFQSSLWHEEEKMIHPIYRVQTFEIVSAYILRVRFDDATEQVINFQPVLAGELYGPLRDLSLFNQVRIDPEVHTLVWPNGADFDPATLHDWPQYIQELAARAKRWELSAA